MTKLHTSENLTIEADEFEKVLKDMETHSISTIKGETTSPIPRYISVYLVQPEIPQAIPNDFQDNLKSSYQQDVLSWNDTRQNELTMVTDQKLNNNISDSDWTQTLKTMEETDIANATARIQNSYAQIREQGNKNPEQRSSLIKFAQTLSNFQSTILNYMVDFMRTIALKIFEWASKAFTFIKNAANSVVNFVKSWF
ncbi:hypothetical protein [Moorena sp. SIO3A2]|uniref:hypothetical protein n=1 Tax=Moorena sp. SIO3A2 TaxID=2607841 RepID=UPI0013B82951|nr:hypothetical protein [Moorena sp. SIO3A2]NER89414.1 hypothetical protein [Moorena sp. SIO3A2]